MKKLLILLLFLVFAAPAAADGESLVRIGIYYGGNAKESLYVICDGERIDLQAQDVSEQLVFTSVQPVCVNGWWYHGSVLITKDQNGLLQVVNEVGIEDYIAAVTAVEMSPSFQMEALKAQAVCARTYALKNLNKHGAYGFDLCDTVCCQAYRGIQDAADATAAAAQATAGEVLTYNGELIDAVYSATSGGWTEDAAYVWGTDLPYLKAAEDAYESKSVYGSTWQGELTADEATRIMREKGYDVGQVTEIVVEEQTPRGVVTRLRVTGTQGEQVFLRESCRTIFSTVTLSQAYTVTPPDGGSGALYAYGGTVQGTAAVLTGSGTETVSVDNVTLQGTTVRKFVLTSGSNCFIFNGRGWGHLVGMSQNGANGMAAAGFTYDEILKHYYKGTEISWN